MNVVPGTKLGRYEIRSKIGAGGMGEVYLAQDTKLDRKVALKILPAEVADHPDRMKRFVQEAKAASAFNHPNIITIHEIDEADSGYFIATEFIDGETLRERIRSAPMRLGDMLDVAAQIANALSAAHAAGIIHRDIKPENIMVRRDGIVKVLDFGLAKLTERTSPELVDTEAPTRAAIKTEPGVIMGTAIYMSPEQARGLQVDARTDVFSLGVLIYEMIAGRLPFKGSNSNEILASVLSDEEPPPLARYASNVPAELERITSKALRKNRDERYQNIKDLLLDLKSLKERLAFEAELERSAPPSERAASEGLAPLGGRTAESKTLPEGGTLNTRPASSAEYLISEIKQHKRGVALMLTVVVLVVGGIAYFFYFARAAGSIDSIAVLPLVNASSDPNSEYLSDGITESIISKLSQLPQLKVMARSTVFRFKGKEIDPQKVGHDLNVRAVLTGRLLQQGESLVIRMELVNVADGTQLWGAEYNRKLSDVLSVQEDISREISEKLRLKLTGEEKQRLTKRYTGNTEAYQLYLQGQYYLSNFRGEEEANKAKNYFEQAIATDPEYALAYAGLAQYYIELGQPFNVELPPKEALREAKAAATRALEIDDTLAEAHVSLAHVMELNWDWSGAEREYKRAIELDPKNARARVYNHSYTEYLQATGRNAEALAEVRRAAELDPLDDLLKGDMGFVFYTSRQYDQAIEQFQKVGHHIGLGWAYQEKKMYQEAIAELQMAAEAGQRGDLSVASLGYAYAISGKKGEAQKLLDELKERSKQRYVSPYLIAYPYAGLNDTDQAFVWLEKGYESHDQWMIWLKSDPKLDSLRSDPRFTDLIRRVGLPQ